LLAFLKRLYWDLMNRDGRIHYKLAFLRSFPGKAGMLLRSWKIPPHFMEAGSNITIHEGVRIRNIHRLKAGDDCEFGVNVFLQAGGDISLGKRVMIGPSAKIWSINHRFDNPDKPISEQGYSREEVIIGSDCWLGANVFVFPGVVLPEGCVVSAGSIVTKKQYPPYAILAGYPARVIGNRKPSTD